ncbi:MAG: EamA family transporter [Bacteroidota bacterium]
MQNRHPYLALVALCFLWGTTYLAIRIGVKSFPPFLFSGIRYLISGLAILLWFNFKKNVEWPSLQELKRIVITGLFIFVGGNLFLVLAEQSVTSGMAALVNSSFPIWIVLITRIWNPEERISNLSILGIFIGFIGQWLIFYEQLFLLSNGAYLLGFVLLIIGLINGSLGSVYMKKFPVKINSVLNAGLQMMICGSVTACIGLFMGEASKISFNPTGWYALFYLVIAGSIIGYSLFVYAMDRLPATIVSVYAYINPIVAIWLGLVILHEPISPKTIIAIGITLIGVFIVNKGRGHSPQKQENV